MSRVKGIAHQVARKARYGDQGLRPWQKRGGGRSMSRHPPERHSAVDFVIDGFRGHPISDNTIVLKSCAQGGPSRTISNASELARQHRLGIANYGITEGGNVAITFQSADFHTLFCMVNNAPEAHA